MSVNHSLKKMDEGTPSPEPSPELFTTTTTTATMFDIPETEEEWESFTLGPGQEQSPAEAAVQESKHKAFFMRKAERENFLRTISRRSVSLHAEEAAGGKPLERFVPPKRGFKGYQQRRRDEDTVNRLQREHHVQHIDLYAMRVNRAFMAEREKLQDKPEPEFEENVKKALKWDLSWQMLSPRYLYYHASEIFDIKRTLELLNKQEGKNQAYLRSMPKEILDAYGKITLMARTFVERFDSIMAKGGVLIDTGEYRDSDQDAPDNESVLKQRFEQARRELVSHDAAIETKSAEEERARVLLHDKAKRTSQLQNRDHLGYAEALHAELERRGIRKEISDRSAIGWIHGYTAMTKQSMDTAVSLYQVFFNPKLHSKDKQERIQAAKEEITVIEEIFQQVLAMDLDQFTFHKDEDLMTPEYLEKQPLLYLGFELGRLLSRYNELKEYPDFRPLTTMSDSVQRELDARKATLEDIHSVVESRVRFLAQDEPLNYSQDELANMSADEISERMSDDIERSHEELCMWRDLIMIKSFDFHPDDDPNRILQKQREAAGVDPQVSDWVEADRILRTEKDETLQQKVQDRVIRTVHAGALSERAFGAARMQLAKEELGELPVAKRREWIENALSEGETVYSEHLTPEFIRTEYTCRASLRERMLKDYKERLKEGVPASFWKNAATARDQRALQQYALLQVCNSQEYREWDNMTRMLLSSLGSSSDTETVEINGKNLTMTQYVRYLEDSFYQKLGPEDTMLVRLISKGETETDGLNEQAVGAFRKEKKQEQIRFAEKVISGLVL